ncbi:MAG TPA: hypothetical protein VIC33_15825 [Vicinamibacterales bacterium]
MKVCPFCFADVPLQAATCTKCRADLVRYIPADTVAGEPKRSRGGQRLLALFAGLFIAAAALGVYYPLVARPSSPNYREIAAANGTHLIALPPAEAAHDADLWWIANDLRGSALREHVLFWTDGSAPSTASLTDADRQRMVAEIRVDVPAGVHQLVRRARTQR